jgi:hypothetical protein
MENIRMAILCYHSDRVLGNTHGTNDHLALEEDLRVINKEGFKIVPLRWLVEWFLGKRGCSKNFVAITFDDGCNADWLDFDHPTHGFVKSFNRILKEFQAEVGNEQPYLQASSFVIASPVARQLINNKSFPGWNLLNDHWWKAAEDSGMFKIYNHSWDHSHPAVDVVCQRKNLKGTFACFETHEECQCEIEQAAGYIAQKIYPSWPDLFAYPYGESNDFIREEYFARCLTEHRTLAAFGAEGGHLSRQSPRWNLPRFISGGFLPGGWQTADELKQILYGK